jgi:hypothetical protein
VYLTSGSAPTFPTRITLFMLFGILFSNHQGFLRTPREVVGMVTGEVGGTVRSALLNRSWQI